jgi:hypothetical protein
MTPKPPTIAHLKGHGLEGLFVIRGNTACQRATAFAFAALGLADDAWFPTATLPAEESGPLLLASAVTSF